MVNRCSVIITDLQCKIWCVLSRNLQMPLVRDANYSSIYTYGYIYNSKLSTNYPCRLFRWLKIHSAQKLREHLFFSIKNVSIFNWYNFGPERRTRIWKKSNLKGEMSNSWISEPNFVRFSKFEVMSHNNESGKLYFKDANVNDVISVSFTLLQCEYYVNIR